jgi:sugar lactone lactonase YvrE
MQDYFGLNWERVAAALSDPAMRSAIFDIWLNRDYSAYARLTGQDLNLPNWQPSRTMRMFIRKDMSARVWERGTSLISVELPEDPYAQGKIGLEAVQIIGAQGTEPGQFQSPRGVAQAPDGSIYVADTGNHRIQHFSPDGEVLQVWGSYSGSDASLAGTAAPGTFNEPWSISVGPDGSVYVADTWNSRIQKFSPQGDYLASWGAFGTAETPLALYGPRSITVDAAGRVFVSDTGNKRVVVYDPEGNPLSVIELGFNEPVGVSIGPDGQLYIADTWNQRVVVASELAENIFSLSTGWSVDGWYGESLDNKPYLAASPAGEVYVSDPESFRMLAFDAGGSFLYTWGSYGTAPGRFTLPSGVAAGADGTVWVVDTASHRVMHFEPPER